jgi:hypothetical protein
MPSCINALCQYTQLINLHALVFGLMSFAWLCSITINPACSCISFGNIIVDLSLFCLCSLFWEYSEGRKQGLDVQHLLVDLNNRNTVRSL